MPGARSELRLPGCAFHYGVCRGRTRNGKVMVTDGPFAETKEVIGGILVLEARDFDHAIQLVSKHPGLKFGPWEIRPAADLNAMVRESEQRRARGKAK